MAGSSALALVNAGVEGFVRAAALEMPRGIRVNAVSPAGVEESLRAMGMAPGAGVRARDVARSYVVAIESDVNGQVLEAVN